MRIIGIDPGLRRTGWGVVQFDSDRLRHVANGVCQSSPSKQLSIRLLEIFSQLKEIIYAYTPTCAAVENTFVSKDPAGTLKLGQARGVALLAPAEAGIPVFEYAPNQIKKAVVGFGHADKVQIEHMVKMYLPTATINGADASDALGVALCHAYQGKYNEKVSNALSQDKVLP